MWCMKPDLYTKAVLTVIAFMLVMIGCRQYVSPTTVVQAEGPFASVQFTGTAYSFFDPRTGEVWQYYNDGTVGVHFRITKLGQRAVETK